MKNNLSNLFLQFSLALLFFVSLGIYMRLDTIKWVFTDTSTYQTTSGFITKSEIGYTYRSWTFYIEYEYMVDNVKYKSSRVHFGFEGSTDLRYSTGYVEKYPVDSSVLVYYDTKKPSDSVLEPHIKEYQQFYIYGIGIFLSIIFLYLSRKYKHM
jgi:hypothetical protein